MAWIESHQSLRDHWKTKKLARLLDIHRMTAIGHLHGLWWWAMDCSRNGSLTHLDPIDIATGCDWDGDGETLIEALVQCQFLDRTESDLMIHNWDLYGGKWQDRRESDARRKRESRSSIGHPADIQETAYVETNKQTKITNKQTKAREEFEEWYSPYPKKENRADAERVWRNMTQRERQLAKEILPNYLPYYASVESKRFIPNPATWLNDKKWLDDDVPEAIQTKSPKDAYVHPSQWITDGTM